MKLMNQNMVFGNRNIRKFNNGDHVIIPSKIHTLSTKSLNCKNYYTTFINKKQHLYSFADFESANNCANFLCDFKSRYGSWPIINEDDKCKIKIQESDQELKETFELRLSEISIDTEELVKLQNYSVLNNIGLLGITFFDYKFEPKKIEIYISACDLLNGIDKSFNIDNKTLNFMKIQSLENVWFKERYSDHSEYPEYPEDPKSDNN